jgi:hypothetical protein
LPEEMLRFAGDAGAEMLEVANAWEAFALSDELSEPKRKPTTLSNIDLLALLELSLLELLDRGVELLPMLSLAFLCSKF